MLLGKILSTLLKNYCELIVGTFNTKMSHQSMLDKAAKMVFASNVPTDMAEDKIREFFGRIGSISSFRIICDKDKDTGKMKAYAVCEYKDQDTAMSAVRTLSTIEVAGRLMKVDHALNEKSRLEMISVMQHAQNRESNEKTPETISKAVASLPPEQMFELLKQMKQCVQNNASEAKNMLLQNSQLAYALLQALVVMRVVDPLVAVTALNNASTASLAAISALTSSSHDSGSGISASSMINRISSSAAAKMPAVSSGAPSTASKQYFNVQPVPPPAPSIPVPPAPVVHDVDFRIKPSVVNRVDQEKSKLPTPAAEPFKRVDPRLQQQSRIAPTPSGLNATSAPSTISTSRAVPATSTTQATANGTAGKPTTASSNPADSEKAALIMQVLRLTDAQIAMLPPEQRRSILLLKEKIAKSAKR